jgi:hypothetical protein
VEFLRMISARRNGKVFFLSLSFFGSKKVSSPLKDISPQYRTLTQTRDGIGRFSKYHSFEIPLTWSNLSWSKGNFVTLSKRFINVRIIKWPRNLTYPKLFSVKCTLPLKVDFKNATFIVLPFCPLKKTSCDAMPLALGQLGWGKIVEEI